MTDGCCSNCGATIPKGDKGDSCKIFIGYATNSSGAGFSLTNGSLPYVAYLAADPTYVPVAGDFAGLWFLRINSYIYIASANDNAGGGFTYPQNVSQSYVAIVSSVTPLTPVAGDFTGLWRKIIGTNGINATIILYNDLAQTPSGDTGGVTTQFETQNIPANTLVNDGDQVNIQVVLQSMCTVYSNTPYAKVNIGTTLCGFISYSFLLQCLIVDITIDRISSSSYLLTSKTAQTNGTVAAVTNIITGANFAAAIAVSVLANTNANSGDIICRKNYADYKPKV